MIIYLTASLLLCGIMFFNRKTGVNNVLLVIFALLQVGFTIYSFCNPDCTSGAMFFKTDSLGLLMLTVSVIISLFALLHSYWYIKFRKQETSRSRAIYFTAICILITSVNAAYLSSHIAVTWIFVEITTLSASALIYHNRTNRSLEGTWKYVFICALSVAFMFIGILFLSMALEKTGSDDLSYDNLMLRAHALDQFWLKLAFLFIFTGFTVKLGLVPMYTAGIDAKDTAPAPAGALFSSILMNMGFTGVFRLYAVIMRTPLHSWSDNIIIIAAVLSIFVAAVYMIKVKNIKRMMSYSCIEHMGIAMLALTAGGIGYYAAILHVLLHAMVKSSLFFQYIQIHIVYRTKHIPDIGNYFSYNFTGAIVLLMGFICVVAIPPSGLFITEFITFQALFQANRIWLLVFVITLLTIIIWAFGKSIFSILFLPVSDKPEPVKTAISPWYSFSQFFLLTLSVYLALFPPDSFTAMINDAIKMLSV